MSSSLMFRISLAPAAFVVCAAALAQAPPSSSGEGVMAVRLPSNAQVTMEADLRDEDVLGFLRQLVTNLGNPMPAKAAAPAKSGHGKTPPAPASTVSTFKVGPNNMSVSVDFSDLSSLLANIHRVHIVGFTASKMDALAFYEPGFRGMGMHRMLYLNNDNGHVLVMTGAAPAGLAVITQNDDDVVVVRVDGVPDLPKLGRVVNEMLTAYVASVTSATPPAPVKSALKPPAKK